MSETSSTAFMPPKRLETERTSQHVRDCAKRLDPRIKSANDGGACSHHGGITCGELNSMTIGSARSPRKASGGRTNDKPDDDSFELHDLRVEVIAPEGQKIYCGAKPGDYFELQGEMLHLPPGQGFSIYSLAALLPLLPAKQRPSASERLDVDRR